MPTDRPLSEKQSAANRATAARSTGPRSPDGKARSARNARCHGFATGDFTVVCLGDLHTAARVPDDLFEESAIGISHAAASATGRQARLNPTGFVGGPIP